MGMNLLEMILSIIDFAITIQCLNMLLFSNPIIYLGRL